jgi:hypothetical protein
MILILLDLIVSKLGSCHPNFQTNSLSIIINKNKIIIRPTIIPKIENDCVAKQKIGSII